MMPIYIANTKICLFVFEENRLSHAKPIPNTNFEIQRKKLWDTKKKHMRYKEKMYDIQKKLRYKNKHIRNKKKHMRYKKTCEVKKRNAIQKKYEIQRK